MLIERRFPNRFDFIEADSFFQAKSIYETQEPIDITISDFDFAGIADGTTPNSRGKGGPEIYEYREDQKHAGNKRIKGVFAYFASPAADVIAHELDPRLTMPPVFRKPQERNELFSFIKATLDQFEAQAEQPRLPGGTTGNAASANGAPQVL